MADQLAQVVYGSGLRPIGAQVVLALEIPEKPPTTEQEMHRANFEAFLAASHSWGDRIFRTACLMFPDAHYKDAKAVSNDHWIAAREAVERKHQWRAPEYPYPALIPNYQQRARELFPDSAPAPEPPRKAPRPRQRWTLERRQRRAVAGLLARAKKQSSFPDWWIPYVQEALMGDPWRYGVCPLPGEGFSPTPYLAMELRKQAAWERDVALDAQPHRVPLHLPLRLPDREAMLVEVNQQPMGDRRGMQ